LREVVVRLIPPPAVRPFVLADPEEVVRHHGPRAALVDGAEQFPVLVEVVSGDAPMGVKLQPVVQRRRRAGRPLPWVNLDEITFRFGDAVDVNAAGLEVHGVNHLIWTLDPAAYSYNANSRTATWRLPAGQRFTADRLTLDLHAPPGRAAVRGAGAAASAWT
jgi:hypothetical protein